MYHLLGWFASLAAGVNQQLLAMADQQFSRQGNDYQMPTPGHIVWAYSSGVTITGSRIVTPSTRLRGHPQIWPFNGALLPTDDPNIMDIRDKPLKIAKEENLRVEASQSAAGPNNHHAFLAFYRNPPNFNINFPDCRWVKATASVTTVANAWSQLGSIVFEDTLEGGSYAIYGMSAFFATAVAARLVFQNQNDRPGVIAHATAILKPGELFREKELGLYGVFDTYSPPQLEVVDNATATVTYNLWLAIAKADGFQPPFRGQ